MNLEIEKGDIEYLKLNKMNREIEIVVMEQFELRGDKYNNAADINQGNKKG